jgi:hypothetical protein
VEGPRSDDRETEGESWCGSCAVSQISPRVSGFAFHHVLRARIINVNPTVREIDVSLISPLSYLTRGVNPYMQPCRS